MFGKTLNSSGYEVYSPRDSIKAALEMKIIDDASRWEIYLTHRNRSVHDYIGVGAEETGEVVKRFLKDLEIIKF